MPMRILHTADWHLGKRLERFERLPEQIQVLEEICAIADREQVDAVIVAGDLFDTFNPPSDAVEHFYRILKRLAKEGMRPVIAIAGNHDSPDRIEAPDPLARECGILFAGYPHSRTSPYRLETGFEVLRSDQGFMELRLPKCPHPRRHHLNRLQRALNPENPAESLRLALSDQWQRLAEQYCDDQGINILVAHLLLMARGQEPPEEPEDEKPILIGGIGAFYTDSIPAQIQYVALGHLHRWQNMPGAHCPCIYASSPLAYSFSEAGQQKYLALIDLAPGQPAQVQQIPLRSGFPLHRQAFESMDTALAWLEQTPDCYVELSLITDTFIQSEDRKRLLAAHPRLIGPIPRLKGNGAQTSTTQVADPTRNREDLFRDYFKHRLSTDPSDRMIDLFREVTALEETP